MAIKDLTADEYTSIFMDGALSAYALLFDKEWDRDAKNEMIREIGIHVISKFVGYSHDYNVGEEDGRTDDDPPVSGEGECEGAS